MTGVLIAVFALGFAVQALRARCTPPPDRRIGRLGLPPAPDRWTDEDCWPWEAPTRKE